MSLTARTLTSVDDANALHAALAQQVDMAMLCDQQRPFPPPDVIASALAGDPLTLFAAYDGDTAIGAAVVITGAGHPKRGMVAWFYAAAGRHDDAVTTLTPTVVAATGQPYGTVQNPAIAAIFEQSFSANVATAGDALTWRP